MALFHSFTVHANSSACCAHSGMSCMLVEHPSLCMWRWLDTHARLAIPWRTELAYSSACWSPCTSAGILDHLAQCRPLQRLSIISGSSAGHVAWCPQACMPYGLEFVTHCGCAHPHHKRPDCLCLPYSQLQQCHAELYNTLCQMNGKQHSSVPLHIS
jgi:hypothetical protein